MWVKNKRSRVVVVLKMRVLRRKWEMTDYQNESLISDCTAGGDDKKVCTVQLGIVVHGCTNTNQNAVMHCPHPVLRSTDIARVGVYQIWAVIAHQWVILILSSPLRISCFLPAPEIFASIDCANVRVTYGRVLSDGTRSGSGAFPGSTSAGKAPRVEIRT
jgi:hypothetical protein